MTLVIEGTWEEIKLRDAELTGRYLRITVSEPVTGLANEATPLVDAENAAAIAYLQNKVKKDAIGDPNKIREADEELAELEDDLDHNRAATGK